MEALPISGVDLNWLANLAKEKIRMKYGDPELRNQLMQAQAQNLLAESEYRRALTQALPYETALRQSYADYYKALTQSTLSKISANEKLSTTLGTILQSFSDHFGTELGLTGSQNQLSALTYEPPPAPRWSTGKNQVSPTYSESASRQLMNQSRWSDRQASIFGIPDIGLLLDTLNSGLSYYTSLY